MQRARQLAVLVGVFAAGSVGYTVLAWLRGSGEPLYGWVPTALCMLAATAALALLTARAPLTGAARRYWLMLTLSGVTSTGGLIAQAHATLTGSLDGPLVLSPATTGCYLAASVLIMGALFLVPVRPLRRWQWVAFGLDGATVVVGSALLSWTIATWYSHRTGTVLSPGPLIAVLAMAFLCVLAVMRISFAGVRDLDVGALRIYACGPFAAAAIGGLTPLMIDRPYLNNAFLSAPAACLFSVWAVVRQANAAAAGTPAATPRSRRRLRAVHLLLPYAAVAFTDGLLLATAGRESRVVAVAAVLTTVLVVARQLVVFHENHRLVARLDATVAELRDSQGRLTFQATHDTLTGLANRSLFTEQLDAALAPGRGIVVALVDLDEFKLVNDSLGHAAGDLLLQAVAARLADATGLEGLAARLGGDEFAVIIEEADAEERLDSLLASFARPVSIGGREVRIRGSIGFAAAWPGATADEIVRRADVAMYSAKQRGTSGRARYTPALDAPADDRSRLADDLRDSLDRGHFRLVYQPIVRLADERLCAVESLVRWHHPGRGLVPPDGFIPVAEETGAIVPLGRWILREACRQAAVWRRDLGDHAPARISVNVSPVQLTEPDFVPDVMAALVDAGLPPDCLMLEVTETAVFAGGVALDALRTLRERGVTIALDDFGTGHSSLGLLLTCSVDVLKVDKAFVAGVAQTGDQAVIVEFVAQIGAGLHIDVVAEGVESVQQAERLHELGYRAAQGFYFSQPLLPDQLAHLIDRTHERALAAPPRHFG